MDCGNTKWNGSAADLSVKHDDALNDLRTIWSLQKACSGPHKNERLFLFSGSYLP